MMNAMITKMIKKNEKNKYFDLAQSVAASFHKLMGIEKT